MPILTVKNNELVSAEEAIKISTNFSDISILRVCYKISETWEPITRDAAYDETCMLAACYTAGYVQAKREERAKVAQKKSKGRSKTQK